MTGLGEPAMTFKSQSENWPQRLAVSSLPSEAVMPGAGRLGGSSPIQDILIAVKRCWVIANEGRPA